MNLKVDITDVVLKTGRLVLRPFLKSDVNDFYEYASVPGVGEMAGWSHHDNIEETRFVLDKFIEERNVFAVVFSGKVIGSVGAENYSDASYPELVGYGTEVGYAFSRDYWGRGFATESVKKFIDFLFVSYPFDFLLSGYFKENKRSERVQRKCGFGYLKTLPRTCAWGEEKETVMNVLYRNEYLSL